MPTPDPRTGASKGVLCSGMCSDVATWAANNANVMYCQRCPSKGAATPMRSPNKAPCNHPISRIECNAQWRHQQHAGLHACSGDRGPPLVRVCQGGLNVHQPLASFFSRSHGARACITITKPMWLCIIAKKFPFAAE